MNYRILSLAFLIMLGGISSLWLLNMRDYFFAPPIKANSDIADNQFYNVAITVTGETGLPIYKIDSPNIKYFANKEYTEISAPKIRITYPEHAILLVTADHGISENKKDKITFKGNVVIKEDESVTSNESLSIYSETMAVYLEKQIASTNSKVSARRGTQKMAAVGMEFDLINEKLQLHNSVSAYLEP